MTAADTGNAKSQNVSNVGSSGQSVDGPRGSLARGSRSRLSSDFCDRLLSVRRGELCWEFLKGQSLHPAKNKMIILDSRIGSAAGTDALARNVAEISASVTILTASAAGQ